MKIRLFAILITLLSVCIMLNSCAIQEVTVDKPKDIKLDKLNFSEIKLSGQIPVNNPNNFGFNVKGVKLDITINGVKVGSLNKHEKIHIKPKSNNAYSINYEAKFKDIIKDPKTLTNAFMQGGAKLQLKGYVKVSKFIISKKIEVEHEQNLGKFKLF